MRRNVLAVVLLSSACAMTMPVSAAAQAGQPSPAISYPQTRRVDLVEPQFGLAVADPYR